MKYKRIDISIPYKVYQDWVDYFKSWKKGFKPYSCSFNINSDIFKIDFLENNYFSEPIIAINISNSKNARIHESTLHSVTMLMVQPQPFVYNNIQYTFDLIIEDLTNDEKVHHLTSVAYNPKWLKDHVYALNAKDEKDVMDVAFALSITTLRDNGTIRLYDKKKQLLEIFIKKISYYGFEFKDYTDFSAIELFNEKTKEEIIKKEIAFVDFLSRYIDIISTEDIETVNRECKKLYENFIA